MEKKVIMVDDSNTVLMSGEMALEDMVASGIIDLKTFDNPLDALEYFKAGNSYDLLITDINMPQMSGFDFAKNAKSIPHLKAKPIVALTTESSPRMKQQGKMSGIAGWITKPFSNEKLIMAIKRVLRIR